jgi:hypothetical protein
MSGALIAALAALRRMLTPATLLLAVAAGLLAGAAVLGLPEPSLAVEVFPALLQVLGALLLLPLAAGLASSERAGGFEQLVAVRRVGSTAWACGRLVGGMLGAVTLALLLATSARSVGGRLSVPVETAGLSIDGGSTWRFPLPAGVQGPFDLRVETLPLDPAGAWLEVSVQRSDRRQDLAPVNVQRRSAVVVVPDLAPARGDLFVTLRADDQLMLRDEPPRLTVGREPLGRAGLPLPREAAGPLLLATLAALAAGCAFHFETACLAGVLVIAMRMPAGAATWLAAILGLVLLAVLGTALQRRAALP